MIQAKEPAVANKFYPGNAHLLKQNVLEYLAEAEMPEEVREKLKGKTVKAVIVPHAGYMYSGPVAAYGHGVLRNLDKEKMWKVLLIGPSHYVPLMGAAPYGDGKWRTPLGEVKTMDIRYEIGEGGIGGTGGVGATDGGSIYDPIGNELLMTVPEAYGEEHSLEVQVPFLQMVLKNFVLYPIVLGEVRPDYLAEKLLGFVEKTDSVIVCSSDLSHYLPYKEALEVDKKTVSGIVDMDLDKVIAEGDACGIKGILTVMFLAEKLGWKPVLLNYKNSGDTAGDKSSVVGYASIAFVK